MQALISRIQYDQLDRLLYSIAVPEQLLRQGHPILTHLDDFDQHDPPQVLHKIQYIKLFCRIILTLRKKRRMHNGGSSRVVGLHCGYMMYLER